MVPTFSSSPRAFSLLRLALLCALVVAALGCSRRDAKALRVGVTSGPHAQIMEVVATEARQRGVEVKVIEFSDYVLPNTALADGSLDVNSFQHLPYLEQQRKDRGFQLEAVGKTVTFPIAAYSTRHHALDALPHGAVVAIPNDPTNGARALDLLAHAGLLRLKAVEAGRATVHDVEWSRGDFRLRELDAAQLVRVLPDVDLAVINTNYVIEGGLDPFKGLLREASDSPYANVLVVRAGDAERPEVKTLVESYHSPAVRAYIETAFHGALVPAW